MKAFKTIVIISVLLIYGLNGNVYAEETQSDETTTEEQTAGDKKTSDQKKEAEEEPECD
jgi:hypothetical protein